MLKNNLNKLKRVYDAFSLVEVLLALSVLSLIVGTLVGALIYGRESTALAGSRGRAVVLAEESLEAVRNIRDEDFSNLVLGTHGLVISGNEWLFSGSSDTIGIFTRDVELSQVGDNTIQVISTVSWQQNPQRTGIISLITYLTNWITAGLWTNPSLGACTSLTGGQDAEKIQVQGNFAYIITKSSAKNFVVIDISDLNAPVILAELSVQGDPISLVVSGDYAYIASKSNQKELQIVDISIPSSPSLVGSFDASGNANGLGVSVVGSVVYLTRSSSSKDELFIIDVSTPSSPSTLGSLNLSGDGNDIVLLDNFAYISSGNDSQELQVVSVSNPTTPTIVGSYNLSGFSDALSITGFDGTAILGRDNGEIYIFDISNPSSPSQIGSLNVGGSVNDLALGSGNNYIFVASDDIPAEFQIIDISDLTSPSPIGSLDTNLDLNGAAYIADENVVAIVSDANPAEFCIVAPQ